MNGDIKAIRDALAAVNAPKCGPQAVDIYKATCNPERIARLLDALEKAQRDADYWREKAGRGNV